MTDESKEDKNSSPENQVIQNLGDKFDAQKLQAQASCHVETSTNYQSEHSHNLETFEQQRTEDLPIQPNSQP